MSARLGEAAAQLRDSLHQALSDTFAAPVWGDPQAMSRALKEVRKSFDSAGAPASEKSIATSVWTFRKTGMMPTFRDLKYTCYGLGLHQGEDESTLLGDEKLFPALLSEVHALVSDARRFRKCYQGLLSSYLNFPADDSATESERKHWAYLRSYLRKQLAQMLHVKPVASWVNILQEHENLLKERPCERYTDGLRKGQWDALEELADRLAISSGSWVWKEAVLAHVQAVGNIPTDAGFRNELDLALHALEGTRVPLSEALRKTGAATLLRRYAKCDERPQHEALLELALRCFGKPWLNTTAWDAYVSDEASMRLIDSWIKTGLIVDFFQLLAEDGVADRSRMAFWPKFVPVISDIWFAMGSFSYENRDPKYVKLRQRIGRERILHFSGAGYTNNAFIMKIGPFFVIEFGQKGRAAYLIHADNWKGDLRPGATLGLEAWRLKSMGGLQMTHMPSDSWGQKFSHEICPRIGWWPGLRAPKADHLPKPSKAQLAEVSVVERQATEPRFPSPPPAPELLENPLDAALTKKLERFNITVEDGRTRNGYLWVLTDDSNPDVNRILIGSGLKYAMGHGWWKK